MLPAALYKTISLSRCYVLSLSHYSAIVCGALFALWRVIRRRRRWRQLPNLGMHRCCCCRVWVWVLLCCSHNKTQRRTHSTWIGMLYSCAWMRIWNDPMNIFPRIVYCVSPILGGAAAAHLATGFACRLQIVPRKLLSAEVLLFKSIKLGEQW
jgi:hypothetical protein